MKKAPCSYEQCGERRRHWCDPDTPRGQQAVDLPDDYTGRAYCSVTCALLDGAMTVSPESGARAYVMEGWQRD